MIIRVAIACRDGTLPVSGWLGPQSASAPPVECVLCIEVFDDGPGFGKANSAVLFRPFYFDKGGYKRKEATGVIDASFFFNDLRGALAAVY